jgi:hypothetical protein
MSPLLRRHVLPPILSTKPKRGAKERKTDNDDDDDDHHGSICSQSFSELAAYFMTRISALCLIRGWISSIERGYSCIRERDLLIYYYYSSPLLRANKCGHKMQCHDLENSFPNNYLVTEDLRTTL